MLPDDLEKDLIHFIIKQCNLHDIAPDDVPYDAPLIGPDSAMDLDSLDAVEVVFIVQREYGLRIGPEETSRVALASIRALANSIRQTEQT